MRRLPKSTVAKCTLGVVVAWLGMCARGGCLHAIAPKIFDEPDIELFGEKSCPGPVDRAVRQGYGYRWK